MPRALAAAEATAATTPPWTPAFEATRRRALFFAGAGAAALPPDTMPNRSMTVNCPLVILFLSATTCSASSRWMNGQTNRILGFVTICDFFERTFASCASSNEGEVFYAMIPDPAAGWTITTWRRAMRGTLIHEAKHVASYAWRYFLEGDVAFLEETWLEEATAQAASSGLISP